MLFWVSYDELMLSPSLLFLVLLALCVLVLEHSEVLPCVSVLVLLCKSESEFFPMLLSLYLSLSASQSVSLYMSVSVLELSRMSSRIDLIAATMMPEKTKFTKGFS